MNFDGVTWAGLLGTLGVTTATAVTAAYLLFRYFGDKWLTGKFKERLEAYKHMQQQELEQLRFQINKTFDWTVKLNTHEFEILPRLWELINDAYFSVDDFTSRIQHYADLNNSNLHELDYVLENSDLPEYQQREIRAADDKTKVYSGYIFWKKYRAVAEKFQAFDRYAIAKTVFLQPPLVGMIEHLRKLMSDALVEKEIEQREPNPRLGRWAKCDLFREEGPDVRDQIQKVVRDRLWSSSAV